MTAFEFIQVHKLQKRRLSLSRPGRYPSEILRGFELSDRLDIYNDTARRVHVLICAPKNQFAAITPSGVVRGPLDQDVPDLM